MGNSKYLAKKYFVGSKDFLLGFLNDDGSSNLKMLESEWDESSRKALILLLHHLVIGTIPIEEEAFQLVKKKLASRSSEKSWSLSQT